MLNAMLDVIACALGLAALAIASAALRAAQSRPPSPQLHLPPSPSLPESPPSPLEGLRIAVDVRQDHPHAVFATLLRDQLLSEDAEVVDAGTDADILIQGNVVCNGYAEVYYEADLTCRSRQGVVCTRADKPPHGDRPSNLAIELIHDLKQELTKIISRSERRRALRELQGPPQ